MQEVFWIEVEECFFDFRTLPYSHPAPFLGCWVAKTLKWVDPPRSSSRGFGSQRCPRTSPAK